jgi:hypothetical protein
MAEQKVEPRKIRDFSENLNDTFLFIKQNFKPLVVSFLGIAGIFILANSIVTGMYQSRMGGIFREIFAGGGAETVSPFSLFSGTYFLVVILSWLSISAMQTAIIAYLKVYETKNGEPATIHEVWEVFKNYYLQVLFYTIPVYLVIIIGFVFCILPGIYLAVVLLPFPVVLMVEDQTFSGAFNRCFAIIKDNFWSSLLIYFVVYLIYAIASGIITAVMAGISGIISYLTTNDVATTIGVVTSILSVLSFVFYIVFYVSVTLHYFTLAEKYDGTGMMKRLDKLGGSNDEFNNVQEQW